jgi:hypothetical protein
VRSFPDGDTVAETDPPAGPDATKFDYVAAYVGPDHVVASLMPGRGHVALAADRLTLIGKIDYPHDDLDESDIFPAADGWLTSAAWQDPPCLSLWGLPT